MSFFEECSPLVAKFEESKTLALGARAKKMAAAGKSIISFASGEPDFNTPSSIVEAAYLAAKSGQTKYTAVNGTPALRSAVASRLNQDYGVDGFEADRVVISTGGKQAIMHGLQAILAPGDEVLILSPYWTSFPEMVKLAGGTPVIVEASDQRVTAADLKKKISAKTKAFIFNSPSNPSGLVFTEQETKELMECILDKNIWLISDDTYYALVYEPAKWVSALRIFPEMIDRSLVVGSTSKSYAMTGWRLGWVHAPEVIAKAITKIQGQVTSGASSISQAAAVEALTNSHHYAEEFRLKFKERRDFLLGRLASISGLNWTEPEGAFYCFIRLDKLVGKGQVSAFCERLLEEFGVCAVPGEAFGQPDFARLSYALSEQQIEEGISRMERALKS